MLDNFFLLYANKLFKDDPKNFKVVFQDFIEQRNSMGFIPEIYEWDVVRLEYLAEIIDGFSNCSDLIAALKWQFELKSIPRLEKNPEDFMEDENFLKDHDNEIDLAFDAVFFYETGWCHGAQHENGSCIRYLSDQHDFGLDDNIRLKCHECRQLIFRGMLMDLVSNKGCFLVRALDETLANKHFPGATSVTVTDNSNRKSLEHYLSEAYNCVEIGVYISTNKYFVKQESFELTNLFDDNRSIYPIHTRFNDYLISIVSYSLVEFLLKNDLNKLKLCPFCNNFFIAKDIRRKRCYSKECERAYQRDRKRKQREKEPDIYC